MNKVAKLLLVCGAILITGVLMIELQQTSIKPKQSWEPVRLETGVVSVSGDQFGVAVHISGEVPSPGVYTVSSNSRVKDAIQLAGGVTAMGNLNRVNLAKRVKDGMKIHVPALKTKKPSSRPTSSTSLLVNINTASLKELTKIKGIGPKTAQNIIQYRNKIGRFETLKDIQNVKGIGPKTFEKIESFLSL
jgi:competence protein ComEA